MNCFIFAQTARLTMLLSWIWYNRFVKSATIMMKIQGGKKETGISEKDENIITFELPKLEECASNVQKGMLQFEHETFVELQSQYFRPLEDALSKKTRPMMQNESTKSEKRQAVTVRRFESHAGDVARGRLKEKAKQITTL